MLISRTISQVTLGGNGSNNPVPWSMDNFDFTEQQLQLTYSQQRVTAFHNGQHQNLQVTGLVHVDALGQPMLGQNDIVYLPCPPYCQGGD